SEFGDSSYPSPLERGVMEGENPVNVREIVEREALEIRLPVWTVLAFAWVNSPGVEASISFDGRIKALGR
nr:hypothetical protein [Tanacetum cinerariifolium]